MNAASCSSRCASASLASTTTLVVAPRHHHSFSSRTSLSPCSTSNSGRFSCAQQHQQPLRRRLSLLAAEPAAAPALSTTDEPTVEEVMNPHPLVLTDTMPIKEAIRLLLEKDVSGAPVVNDKGVLVGVLSESDVIYKGAGTPNDHFIIPPVFIGFADAFVFLRDNKEFEKEVHKILAKTVGEAMSTKPIFVTPAMTMTEAAQVMVRKEVNRLPVVGTSGDDEGKVVGVISRHDVLRGLVATNSVMLVI